jgi:hypothetical protein
MSDVKVQDKEVDECLNLASLPDTAEFILSTNLKNDVSIVGVAKGRIRDSKQDPWRDSYLVVYQLGAGPKKRAELNKELYGALALVFDTILELNSPYMWEEEVNARETDCVFLTER